MSALKLLKPNQMVDSIYDIDLQQLKQQGIKAIIADLDNTLVPWRSSEVQEKLVDWINTVRDADLKIAIVSNNTSARVEAMSSQLGVIALGGAIKPRRGAFRSIAAQFNLYPKEVAVVGDQLFTDILGGNRTGMHTILVTPMSTHEFIGTKIVRQIEKVFLRNLNNKST
ncbi:YqeG family HAD IIIA-type phosphatase [Dethiobacter alkaliphilus]|uniref:YqeG family HAD IIIA-type phosphatase n=1 Tax=Dethiobacter alkaliphilus TaxID=427926 RepID=UPI00222676D2|nr:YqeG family HAD IIIA-type phosphatase [Dethiobacter alkaliphilus]MCW3490345.1 YqeG family HAD IIIA-type phosphatase [Dethiobacter alkaliphilus]